MTMQTTEKNTKRRGNYRQINSQRYQKNGEVKKAFSSFLLFKHIHKMWEDVNHHYNTHV